MSSEQEALTEPLFIGGTGRSGTTVLGHLLGQHSTFFHPAFELKLHSEPGSGLPALVRGSVSLEQFETTFWNLWFTRPGPGDEVHGVHRHATEEEMRSALRRMRRRLAADPLYAARSFVREIMEPPTRAAGARHWIDTTPSNIGMAPFLLELFPDLRAIHIVRNGLDAACSVMGRTWGPNTMTESLEWWDVNLRRSDQGVRALPEDRVLTVQFEDLVRRRREETYEDLLNFMEIEDEPAMRRYFDKRMSGKHAHLGRWRKQLTPAQADRAAFLYEEMLARQRADGIACVPEYEPA